MKTLQEYSKSRNDSLISEALDDKLDEKTFAKLASMPASVAELRSACATHSGFKTLQKKAAAASFEISSGFIRYIKMVDKKGKTLAIGLDDVILNYDAQTSKGLTDWEIRFQSDHYGCRTDPAKSNKMHLNARIHMNMDDKELLTAKKEIGALVDFVVWFNAQKIEKMLPVFGETRIV